MKYYIAESGTICHLLDDQVEAYKIKTGVNTLTEISADKALELTAPKIDHVTVRIKEIESRLSELDLLSLRPLRTIEAGSATQYDHDKLIELDAESNLLRTELRGLLL